MQLRRWLFFLVTMATGWLVAPAGRAQCLPLELLDQGIAAGRTRPDSLRALLALEEVAFDTWVEHPGPDPYWTYTAPRPAAGSAAADTLVDAWVGLRRSNQHTYYDLVYKTTSRECIVQLRGELRRRGKLKSEVTNCVQCEGERLVGKDYTVTIFTQKAAYAAKSTPFPYVLVLRRAEGAGPPETSSPVVNGQ